MRPQCEVEEVAHFFFFMIEVFLSQSSNPAWVTSLSGRAMKRGTVTLCVSMWDGGQVHRSQSPKEQAWLPQEG